MSNFDILVYLEATPAWQVCCAKCGSVLSLFHIEEVAALERAVGNSGRWNIPFPHSSETYVQSFIIWVVYGIEYYIQVSTSAIQYLKDFGEKLKIFLNEAICGHLFSALVLG